MVASLGRARLNSGSRRDRVSERLTELVRPVIGLSISPVFDRRTNAWAIRPLTDWTYNMARYLVLIYGDEQTWLDASPEWGETNALAHADFNNEAGPAVLGGAELEGTAKAVSLRGNSSGGFTTTDGPFVETKEVIGGYYLLEARDLEDALRLAGRIPEASSPTSGVEVRPIKSH